MTVTSPLESLALTRIVLVAGSMSGLTVRECGQIGVKRVTASSGWTIDPPAAREYAVEPVGVDRIKPSALILASGAPSIVTSRFKRFSEPPLITTSFNAWVLKIDFF